MAVASERRDPFQLAAHGEAPALIDAARGLTYSYAQLKARADALAGELAPANGQRALVFVSAALDVGTIVAYLGSLAAGHALFLMDQKAHPSLRDELIARYRPDFVLRAEGADVVIERREPSLRPLHQELSVLLSTSGTTGSPKLVRLALRNVLENARSIAEYLALGRAERALASLPFHYSYGLSVLNSHLLAGGSVVISNESIMRPELWAHCREHACTSFAGVPYSYQILRRTGFEKQELPTLRTLTQAGGKLAQPLIDHYQRVMAERGGRFIVMYGQTEATARMSYLPPERAHEKVGSIGIPIPRGRLRVFEGERELTEVHARGELVYEGPNVMLGYATCAEELALGDEQRGVLRTGDVGHRDSDGYFYITGRLKRFAKVYGLRINLDEVEEHVRKDGPAAAVSDDERITVYREASERDATAVRNELAALFQLNVNTFAIESIDALPLLTNGKIDYDALQRRGR